MRRNVRPELRAVLADRAGAMRAAPTMTESILWGALSGSQLGVGFRRQVALGRFIADFAAPSARLVVEFDGGYHAARVRADARRDRVLARLGWRVLHLDAGMVQHNLPDAVALIRAALAGG